MTKYAVDKLRDGSSSLNVANILKVVQTSLDSGYEAVVWSPLDSVAGIHIRALSDKVVFLKITNGEGRIVCADLFDQQGLLFCIDTTVAMVDSESRKEMEALLAADEEKKRKASFDYQKA